MNCPICFEDTNAMYTIPCGSKTPHQICNTCEIAMRLLAKPTNRGRFITCPMCRAVETVQGTRTVRSYEAELLRIYAGAIPAPRPRPAPPAPRPAPPAPPPVPPAPRPEPRPAPRPEPLPYAYVYTSQWCQSGLRDIGQCATKGKTKRFCSILSCTNKVCRKCKQCTHH